VKVAVLYYQDRRYLSVLIPVNRLALSKVLKPTIPYRRHFVYNQVVLRYNITGYRIIGLVKEEILMEDELKNPIVLEIPVT